MATFSSPSAAESANNIGATALTPWRGGKPPRLVLADHQADGAVLAGALEALGVHCERVTDGALAVAAVCAVHYDGALLALDMPVLDGRTATTVLRTIGFDRPVILITTQEGLDKERAGAGARTSLPGCTLVAGKPLDAAALQTILMAVGAMATPPSPAAGDTRQPAHGADPGRAGQPPSARPAGRGDPRREEFGDGRRGAPPLPPSDTGFEDLPAFAGFRASFRAALGARLFDMGRAAAGADWQELARQAHNLKGAGGTFGFPQVSGHATDIELAAQRFDAAAVGAALARLRAHVDVLNGTRSGLDPAP